MALSATSDNCASTSPSTLIGVFALVRGPRRSFAEDRHQLPQQALVLDDADVALDVQVLRNSLAQEREVSRTAYRVQLLPLRERIHDRQVVDCMPRRQQVEHRLIDSPVRVERKILDLQLSGSVADCNRILQHCAEDCDLVVD